MLETGGRFRTESRFEQQVGEVCLSEVVALAVCATALVLSDLLVLLLKYIEPEHVVL